MDGLKNMKVAMDINTRKETKRITNTLNFGAFFPAFTSELNNESI